MSYNPFSLKGKIIFITGASSGIGKAAAIECSKMGASVVLTGRNQQKLENTYNQLEGGNHLMYVADLNYGEEIESLIIQIPVVDGIVHCAGLTKNIPFQFATRENLDEVLNINFYAAAEITRKVLKLKKINKNGFNSIYLFYFWNLLFVSCVSYIFRIKGCSKWFDEGVLHWIWHLNQSGLTVSILV